MNSLVLLSFSRKLYSWARDTGELGSEGGNEVADLAGGLFGDVGEHVGHLEHPVLKALYYEIFDVGGIVNFAPLVDDVGLEEVDVEKELEKNV